MRSLAVFPRPTEPAELAAMVHLDDVVRVFGRGDGQVRALDGVTLSMARGSFTAIMGPSGSGKSTLLQLAAGLDRPTQGSVRLGELELNGLNERALARLRRERIGFVFQSFNLLGALTAEQNVALPARLAGRRLPRSVVRDVLERVGLDERRGHRPAQLSGGQQQRVAIARALSIDPKVMLFDEPTSALDPELVGEVLQVIRDLAREGWTMVIVTHEIRFAQQVAEQVLFIDGGVVAESGPPEQVLTAPTLPRTRQFLQRILDPI